MDHQAFWIILPIVCACIAVLTSALGGRKSGSSRLPPGPHPFPIIGNILELGNKPHQDVAKLSKTYGPLMTLKLGSITTIVISSPDIAKEALQKNDQAFSGRTIPDTCRVFDHHKVSIVWLPALARWRNFRKVSATQIFAPQQLDATQALRQQKVQELLDHVNQCCSNGGKVVDIGRAAFITILNAISNTFFSIDLAHYSSDLSGQDFQELVCVGMELGGKPNIADYFPLLRLVDPQGARRRMAIYYGKLIEIFDRIINERVQLRASEGSNARNDLLDSFLNLAEDDNSDLSRDDFKHLLLVLTNFLIALLLGLTQHQAQLNGQWQSYFTTLKKWQRSEMS
ncbi:geraniol 8-hydroxylase [Quercus suber]|uniref:Geraniol 8-hydroxylase n=1 Tax=Quercus suber TaxID=58331 RepID=A0AAW0LA91_QUESU